MFGCSSERHRVWRVENKVIVHVILTFAMGECDGVRRTDMIDVVCGAYIVERSGERWAVGWCVCRDERNGIELGEENASMRVWCWRLEKVMRSELPDFFVAVCGGCIMNR